METNVVSQVDDVWSLHRGVRKISLRRSHQATSWVQSPVDPDREQGVRTSQQGERQLSRRDASTGPQEGTESPCRRGRLCYVKETGGWGGGGEAKHRGRV